MELTTGLRVCVSGLVAGTIFGVLGYRLPVAGTTWPTDASVDSPLHSVISSLSGWGISLAGSVTQYHRDQGWSRHQEWLCHRVGTDGTPFVLCGGCQHPARPFLCHRETQPNFLESRFYSMMWLDKSFLQENKMQEIIIIMLVIIM